MNFTDKKAYDKLIKCRSILLVQQPFFGCLALHADLVEVLDPNLIDTMAVDGFCMYYHPPFVMSLTEPELVGVVAHEVLHMAYKHMSRRSNRHPIIWNWAGDYVINADLLKANFTLPKERLHDPKYDGMSTEEVYERIRKDVEKAIKQAQGSQGKGKGKGQGGGGQPMLDPLADKGKCGGVMDAGSIGKDGKPAGGAADKAAQQAAEREWDATVRVAVNVAKRQNAGNIPGYLERLVKILKEPQVSWREYTRQFIDVSMIKDYSWSRPNRRHLGDGLHLPGFISDALHHLVFVVDTSGSIDQKMLEAMGGEIAGALDDGVADKLTVIYADTQVQHVDEFMPGDPVSFKIHGGGGTDFADSFRWIGEHAADAACIIYLTDMLTSSFGQDVGIPTLWGAYLPQAMLANIKPPFGEIVSVDTSL
jgi:predicted metal-dependent peptidase